MGSAKTSGESRAKRAAEEAINSPLLNNQNINGAQKILLSIISGEEAELQMDELTDITDFMQEFAGDEAEVIFGHGVDPDLGDSIRVTVIATGFDHASNEEIQEQQQLEQPSQPENLLETDEEPEKKVFDLESNKQIPLFIEKNPEPSKDFFADEEEDTLEEESYSFDFIPKTPKKEETDDFTFDFTEDLIDEYDVVDDNEEEEDAFLEELDGMAHPPSKKILLMEQARQRVEKLKGLKKSEPESNEDFKERLDVPAYLRKKVELKKVPHSTERNISKYNLNDDNHIIGNNKFLHDNVD